MDNVVTSAVAMLDGVEHGSISLVQGRRHITSAAASDALAREFDSLEGRLGEGPCLDAMYQQPVGEVADLSTERRWSALAQRGPKLGVRSMLCFQLFVHGNTLGALNLLAGPPSAFDTGARPVGEVLAAHAAVTLADSQQIYHLGLALVHRDTIGQAKGILMERYHLTADQAFTLLVRSSQDRNLKLHVVAEELPLSGSLDG